MKRKKKVKKKKLENRKKINWIKIKLRKDFISRKKKEILILINLLYYIINRKLINQTSGKLKSFIKNSKFYFNSKIFIQISIIYF